MNRNLKVLIVAVNTLLTLLFYSCNSETRDTNQTASNLRIITHNIWYGFSKVPTRKETWIAWMNKQQPDIYKRPVHQNYGLKVCGFLPDS